MATPTQRSTMSTATFIVSQCALAAYHEGALGFIVGCGITLAVWKFADEIIPTKEEGNTSLPATTSKKHSFAYRLLTPKDRRTVVVDGREEGIDMQEEDVDFTLNPDSSDFLTFAQLIETRVIQKMILEDRGKPLLQRRILIGYNDHKLYFTTMESLYSCGIGGVGRTGKSTTVRFLLFQLLLLGFRLVMIDPHITHTEQSLAYQFKQFSGIHAMPPCDATEENLLSRIRKIKQELTRRISNGIDNGVPVLLIIDEFNGVMRRASEQTKKELADLLLDIEQEGGKFNIYAWIIGHRWSENDLGGKGSAGVAIRTSLVSKIAHRFSDETQAAVFMGSSSASVKQQNASLPVGSYVFMDANGFRMQITTPLTLAKDAVLVTQLLNNKPARTVVQSQSAREVHTDGLEMATREPATRVDLPTTTDDDGDRSTAIAISTETHTPSDDDDETTTNDLPTDWTQEQVDAAREMYKDRVTKENILKYLNKKGTAAVRRKELDSVLGLKQAPQGELRG